MANLTRQQLDAANAMIAGTHDRIDPTPRMQQGYTLSDIYKGILPAQGSDSYDTSAPVYEVGYRSVDGSAGVGASGNGGGHASIAPEIRVAQVPGPNAPAKTQDRLSPGIAANAFAYGNPSVSAPGINAISAALRAPTGSAWSKGGWGSGFDFLSGDPGQVDWSKADQGNTGLYGMPGTSIPQPKWQPRAVMVAAPQPKVIVAAAKPKVGFNGKTSVTGGELAGANKNFGGANALMPDSMNNSRWLTGY